MRWVRSREILRNGSRRPTAAASSATSTLCVNVQAPTAPATREADGQQDEAVGEERVPGLLDHLGQPMP